LCSRAESGIKRIVPHRGLCSGVDLPRSEPGAEPLLLKRNSNWKRISFLGYDSESVIQVIGQLIAKLTLSETTDGL
jgi:hypothetical protein